jgi:hypothetical protein
MKYNTDDVGVDVETNSNKNSPRFKFPFHDSQDDLDLSKSYFSMTDEFVSSSSVSPPNPTAVDGHPISYSHYSRDDTLEGDTTGGFSDEFRRMELTVSPIAKSRDSDERHNIIIDDRDQHQPSIIDNTTNHTTASPSSRHDDLQSARKQVGESSSNFIDKIRYAAHKRKVAVTRSRDSLVAKEKEQEQLRSIAESKSTTAQSTTFSKASDDSKENYVPERRSEAFFKNPFKNKTSIGFGGFGVPKVEKRPTTTPFSPLLGSRRKEKIKPKSLRQPKISFGRKSTTTSKSSSTKSFTMPSNVSKEVTSNATATNEAVTSSPAFKARPAPSSTGIRGHAGQIGVPKVPKRPVTVPKSPCLGPKRQSSLSNAPTLNVRTSTETTSSSSGEYSGLLGLHLLGSTPKNSIASSDTTNQKNVTPPQESCSVKPFEPLSTCRANRRAEYDSIRDKNRQARLEEERKQLQIQIKKIQKELLVMGKDLKR